MNTASNPTLSISPDNVPDKGKRVGWWLPKGGADHVHHVATDVVEGKVTDHVEKPTPETFNVTLTIPPGDVPSIIRLRHALKHLLRCWDIRCVQGRRLEVVADRRTT